MGLRHGDNRVGGLLHPLPEPFRGDGQHRGPPGLHLHHVAHGLVKEGGIGPQGHHQRPRLDEGDGPVLQLSGGVGLRVDVADFLQLQGTLQTHGVIQVSSNEENAVVVEETGGEILRVLEILQVPPHLLRQGLELHQYRVVFAFLHRPQQVRQIQPHQVQRRQLGGIALAGGHSNLRPRPGVEHVVRLPGDGAAHHVADGQGPASQALGLPESRHGVQGLPGLADGNDQGVLIHQRPAVAEFRGQRHLHRAAEQTLPGVFPHHSRMIGGAAGNHVDVGDAFDVVFRQADVVQHHTALPDTGENGFLQGLRLFQNLLEHEVGEAALLGGGRVPVDAAVLLLQGVQLIVEHIHTLRRQHGDLPVIHIGHVPGVADDGGGVGGDEVLPLPKADDQRAVLPGGNQGVGVVRADDAESIGPLDAPQAPAHGFQHVPALLVVKLQEVSRDFRVRLGGEGHPLPGELFL